MNEPRPEQVLRRGALRSLRGANVHYHRTVCLVEIDLGLVAGATVADIGPDGGAGFSHRFLERFDRLTDQDGGGTLSGALRRDLVGERRTALPELFLAGVHSLEAYAARVAARHDAPVFGVVQRLDETDGRVLLVWESSARWISRLSVEAAFAGIAELVLAADARMRVEESLENFTDRLEFLRARAARARWSPGTAVLAAGARAFSLPSEALVGSYLRLGEGVRQRVLSESVFSAPPASPRASAPGDRDAAKGRGPEVLRLLVGGPEVLGAVRFEPPTVLGDGHRGVDQLVAATREDPVRQGAWRPIDTGTLDPVQEPRRRTEIPGPGVAVRLDEVVDFERGAVPVDVTDAIGPEIARAAVDAVRRAGRRIAGVEVRATNLESIPNSIRIDRGRADPSLWATARGADPARLGSRVLAAACDLSAIGRVPHVVILGSRGTRFAGRAVERLFRAQGLGVGYVSGRRIAIHGREVAPDLRGRSPGPGFVLSDPGVDVFVLGVSPGRLLRRGMQTEHADLLAWTGGTADADPAASRSALLAALRVTSGPVILPAESPELEVVRERVEPDRLILVGAGTADEGRRVMRSEESPESVELVEAGRKTAALPLSELMPVGARATAPRVRHALIAAALAFALGIGRDETSAD